MTPAKLLIANGSALVRNFLKKELGGRPEIDLLGTAKTTVDARDLIVELKPQVVLLDIELPKALEFISILMEHWPISIIVLAPESRADLGKEALAMGAMLMIEKPQMIASGNDDFIGQMVKKIMSVKGKKPRPRSAKVVGNAAPSKAAASPKATKPNSVKPAGGSHASSPMDFTPTPIHLQSDKIIAIGASTGGTEAIKRVLEAIPAGLPGIVMVQHMPEGFTHSFAERLDTLSPNLEVREAVNGDEVRPGLVLLAPGDKHMVLERKNSRYYVKCYNGELVNRHMPSVDVLFDSVAEVAGSKAIGVILTGMGADGAKGLLHMRKSGAKTMSQDEETCVVYGMPREAHLNGGSEKEVPLSQVAVAITNAHKKLVS